MSKTSLQAYHQEQLDFFTACRNEKIRHPLLARKVENAGFWIGKLENALKKGLTSDDAEIFVAALGLDWGWPWKDREAILTEDKVKRWLRCLTKLNEAHPILCDTHEDLFNWLCDIFNYIPREIWTAAARLISALIYNSRSFKACTGNEQGLCDDFDMELQRLMPLAYASYKTPKTNRTSKGVFTEMGSKIEGNESHSHRHGLYLLWLSVLYNPTDHPKLFQDNQIGKPFRDIRDSSCKTVLYVSIFEALFFSPPTVQPFSEVASHLREPFSTLQQWNSFLRQRQTIALRPEHRQVCVDFMKKSLLYHSWASAKIDAQCYAELSALTQRISPEHHSEPLYLELQQWLSMQQPTAFSDLAYDLISEWGTRRKQLPEVYRTASILESQYQSLVKLTTDQKIQRMGQLIRVLFSRTHAKCLSSEAIKRDFFDYWTLITDGQIFEDKRFNFWHHFHFVEEPILDAESIQKLKDVESQWKSKNDIQQKQNFTILLIVSAFLQADDIPKKEMSHFVRSEILVPLFDLKGKKTDTTKIGSEKRLAAIITDMLGNSKYKLLFTPLTLPLYHNLILHKDKKKTPAENTIQAFKYFLELFTQNPVPEYYTKLGKNFDISYHLMQKPNTTKIPWGDLCQRFKILDEKRDEIVANWNAFKDTFQADDLFQGKIDLLTVSNQMLVGLKAYSNIWEHLNTNFHKVFFDEPYPIAVFEEIVVELRNKTNFSSFHNLSTTVSWYQTILQKIKVLETWMNKHGYYQIINLELPFINLVNIEELLAEGDLASAETICKESASFLLNPEHNEKMSWPERFLWISVVAKMLHEMRGLVVLKRQFTVLDNELAQANFGFHMVEQSINRLNKGLIAENKAPQMYHEKLLASTYWAHLHDVHGSQTKEIHIIQQWMNQRDEGHHSLDVDRLLQVFADSPLPDQTIILLICEQIALNPLVLGEHTRPILNTLMAKRNKINSLSKEPPKTVQTITSRVSSLLAKRKMFDLLATFAGKDISLRKRLSRRRYFMPIVLAYTLSLTQLLDIGDGLVELSGTEYGMLLSVGATLMSAILHFALPHNKLRRYGYAAKQSILNTLPTFFVSIFMAVIFTYAWLWSYPAEDLVNFSIYEQLLHFVWTYFFSEMVIAAGRGAFDYE